MKKSLFERYPKVTLTMISALLLIVTFFILNKLAGSLFGLGKVIVYEASPIFGYRPLPNQHVARHPHQVVKTNNLGLRANHDWEMTDFHHKILFLGDSVTYGGSYISNEKLFSQLVVNYFPQYHSANAGVNGWGVNNVHAFIKEMAFLPAQVYVSVFPEGDFYRGLNRIGGQPYWTRKPTYPLEEFYQFIIYQLNLKKTPTTHFVSANDKSKVVNIALRNLKDLDTFLKQNDRDHLIFITPTRSQLLGFEKKDDIIKNGLIKYGLKAIYIQDILPKLSKSDIEKIYHDEIHLSEIGHQQWAKLFAYELNEVIQQRESTTLFVQKPSIKVANNSC
ncbi:MAG: hypothetical protein JSS07_06735 [Proteobacteria bacterium]|nr:hypothetical protein [Pseudomonadota bacterium]